MFPVVKFKKLVPEATAPEHKTIGAAGADLYAVESVVISSERPTIVRTGLALELPAGYEAQVRSRSGLAARGVFVVNAPGTIDWDYRGEIKVILGLLASEADHYEILEGDRIAQLVIKPVQCVNFTEVSDLNETDRGTGGFGSTGR
jgi:dUTP pyrophosphatase